MSFIRAEAVTGFTFGLIRKTTGTALTGTASGIGKYITKDGGTQASIAGSIAEEGNGQYSVDLTAAGQGNQAERYSSSDLLGLSAGLASGGITDLFQQLNDSANGKHGDRCKDTVTWQAK